MNTVKPRIARAKPSAPSNAELMAAMRQIADRQDAIAKTLHAMALEVVNLAMMLPVISGAAKDALRAAMDAREKVALIAALPPSNIN